MQFDEFIWNLDVVDKLAVKHGVETWEVEEVFDNSPYIRFRERGRRDGENLYSANRCA